MHAIGGRGGARAGLGMRRPQGFTAAKASTWCDFSQNSIQGGARPPSFCPSTLLGDNVQDRVVLPVEMLRALGWTAGGGAGGEIVPFQSRSETHARGLVGECQALQPLAVASWALILAAGEALPGLWSAEASRGPAPRGDAVQAGPQRGLIRAADEALPGLRSAGARRGPAPRGDAAQMGPHPRGGCSPIRLRNVEARRGPVRGSRDVVWAGPGGNPTQD